MKQKPSRRNTTIDMLRGLSIMVMIFIHTSAYYQSGFLLKFLWNYTHFAVPVFVFCSLYLFFRKNAPFEWKTFPAYLHKRFVRLLVPFYLFAAGFFFLAFLLDPESLSRSFIIQTLTLTGGKNENWLVVLFLYVTVLAPLVSGLIQRAKPLAIGYALCAVASSVVLLFWVPDMGYRWSMWLPWSVIGVFAWFMAQKYEKPKQTYATILGISGFVFVGLTLYLWMQEQSLILTHNKYPPNIYYLSFGVAAITTMFWYFESFPVTNQRINAFISFFSLHSYSLFFIHTLVIYVVNRVIGTTSIAFLPYFFLVFIVSAGIQAGWNRVVLSKI